MTCVGTSDIKRKYCQVLVLLQQRNNASNFALLEGLGMVILLYETLILPLPYRLSSHEIHCSLWSFPNFPSLFWIPRRTRSQRDPPSTRGGGAAPGSAPLPSPPLPALAARCLPLPPSGGKGKAAGDQKGSLRSKSNFGDSLVCSD